MILTVTLDFRELRLVYNESKDTVSYKQAIAEVISHELLHQWLGNIGSNTYASEMKNFSLTFSLKNSDLQVVGRHLAERRICSLLPIFGNW